MRSNVLAKVLVLVGVAVAAAVFVDAARAQEKKAGAAEVAGEEEGGERKSMHQREFTKVRKGSSLKADEPLANAPDLRGRIQKLRDRAVLLHYERLARLDVIGEVASSTNDQRLHDRVDEVRRRELERFRKLMDLLRDEALAAATAGEAAR